MSTSRKYWVVSPNVRFDAKTVAAWRQASVKWQAAFMGWHPDDEAHRLGPKFARGIGELWGQEDVKKSIFRSRVIFSLKNTRQDSF
jgi:hypothetical protein